MASTPRPVGRPAGSASMAPAWMRARSAVGLALLVAACGSTSRPRAPEVEASAPSSPYAVRADDSVPEWLGQPLSWDKLGAIERWLASAGPGATPFWRVEGELALASGRLELARRELEAEPSKAAALAPRARAAHAGFERVLAGTDANERQRRRAQEWLASAERLMARTAGVEGERALAVIPRAEWGALAPKPRLMERTVGGYSRITVHHSADADPVELDGSLARSAEAVQGIQRAHMNGQDTRYGDIGYHFVVDPSGRVFAGRDLTWQGAHAKGDNNVRNVGVCMLGNFDVETPTEAALATLRRLIEDLRARHAIPRSRVYCHHDLRTTRCPGVNLARWVEGYRGDARVTAAAPSRAPARNVR